MGGGGPVRASLEYTVCTSTDKKYFALTLQFRVVEQLKGNEIKSQRQIPGRVCSSQYMVSLETHRLFAYSQFPSIFLSDRAHL